MVPFLGIIGAERKSIVTPETGSATVTGFCLACPNPPEPEAET